MEGALTGYGLTLFRIARRLRLWDLFNRVQSARGRMGMLPWYDPFDTTHVMLAISSQVASQTSDYIEISHQTFVPLLATEIRELPGFDADDCFLRLMNDLPDEPNPYFTFTYGPFGVRFTIYRDRSRFRIIVVVLWRRPTASLQEGAFGKRE